MSCNYIPVNKEKKEKEKISTSINSLKLQGIQLSWRVHWIYKALVYCTELGNKAYSE
jgi:hypothetical protein